MLKFPLKKISIGFFEAYTPSAISFAIVLFLIPYLHRNFSHNEWDFFASLLTAAGFTTLFDLGLSQSIAREIQIRHTSPIWRANATSYLMLAIAISAPVSAIALIYAVRQNISLSVFIIAIFWLAFQFIAAPAIAALQAFTENRRYIYIYSGCIGIRVLLIILYFHFGVGGVFEVIVAYFVSSLLETTLYIISLRKLGLHVSVSVFKQVIDLILRFSFWWQSFVIFSGGLVAQLDRIISIRFMASEIYGQYILISTYCLMFLALQYPAMRYLVPRYFITNRRAQAIKVIFALYSFLGVFFVVTSRNFFYLWSGIDPSAELDYGIFLLSIGVTIQGAYNILYQMLILNGNWAGILMANFFSVVSVLLFSTSGADLASLSTGGKIWIVFGSVQLVTGVILLTLRRRWAL